MNKYLLKDFERIVELKSEIFGIDLNFLDLGDLERIQEYEADLELEILTYFDLDEIYNSEYDKIEEIYNQWCDEITEEVNRFKKEISNLEKKTVDKKRALKDLCDLHYAQGLHSGRWENELAMDSSAEEYVKTMKTFADEYNIIYDDDLSHYIEDEEYEAECYTMDRMGYEIFILVEKHLVEIVLNG